MASQSEILARLRDALTLSDPEWDVSVGTPEYKILEAVSSEIATVYNDGMLNNYHLDVDLKAGTDLDDFVQLFGMYRLLSKRAVGTVTFQRGVAADQDYNIASGVQVVKPATSVSPAIYFQTITSATIPRGQTEVEVPIEAAVGGTSGNVVAGAITAMATQVGGATSVVNQSPLTGGRDPESDTDLRIRWKTTVFRNLAGTISQFQAIALDDPSVTRATVIGPQNRYTEQLQIPAGSPPVIISQVIDSKYTFPPGGEFIGYGLNQEDQNIALRGSDYTYLQTVPFSAQILDTTNYTVGSILNVEHEYTPKASRNDPANGVTHKVDIFVSGQESTEALEEVTMNRSLLFSGTGALGRENWRRVDDTTQPTVGNFFMRLQRAPVLSLPPSITIGTTTYFLNTHYWFVRDIGSNRGSTLAQDGIEWLSSNSPTNNQNVIVTYRYNNVISRLNEQIRSIGLVGQDTLVHQSTPVNLRFHLAVVYNTGVQTSSVDNQIDIAVTNWLEGKGFKDNVQISDLIDTVKNVEGVDNVRLVKSTEDSSNYGIVELAWNTTTVKTRHTGDIYLQSDQVPVNIDTVIVPKAQNTF